LLIMLTGKRQFRCRGCDCVFRAPDRRKAPREVFMPGVRRKLG
jgi:hypothetical protein